MTNYIIENLADNPSWISEAAQWFSDKWDIPTELYRESMEESVALRGQAVPQWFVIRENSGSTAPIIADCGIIENDFHDRPDLAPNLCALYVEESYRGQGIAKRLLDHARIEAGVLGFDFLYLVTDLQGFYEKCGWEYLLDVKENDGNPIRMYQAAALIGEKNQPSLAVVCEEVSIVIQEVNPRNHPMLTQDLVALWRTSVEATHGFLAPQDIDRIAEYVPQAIEGVEHLIVAKDDEGTLLGFIGITGNAIEMLFLHPLVRGRGIGSRLLNHAVDVYGANRVDVNEQNDQARGFYEHVGFEVVERFETDDMGDPFPILRMKLKA